MSNTTHKRMDSVTVIRTGKAQYWGGNRPATPLPPVVLVADMGAVPASLTLSDSSASRCADDQSLSTIPTNA